MPLGSFVLFTAIGATAWNSILAALGYYLHSVVDKDHLMEQVSLYTTQISWIWIGIGVLALLYIIYKMIWK
jgi:membrane protein DedA with SNARE-associated domain